MSSGEAARASSRVEFVALFALLTSLTALALDAVLPGLPAIGESLAVTDDTEVQFVVTLFIFGMVFGELLFGPLCDAIGRKPAILVGLAIFCLGSLVAMTAGSLEQLVLGRIIQGVGVSGPKIGARAVIRDRFAGARMAQVMSLIFTILILIPMIAPALGQGLLGVFGWRAIFAFYLATALFAGTWLALRHPETLARQDRIPLSLPRFARNAGAILRHRGVMAYTAAAGLIFGAQLLYLSVAQSIIGETYGKGAAFPLWFAVLALAVGVASFANSRMVTRHGMTRLLSVALAGLGAISGGLLVVALGYGGVPPFAVFLAGYFGMFFCVGILFGNLNALAMQWLGRLAGLGAALIASISSLIAVVFSVTLGLFHSGTIVPVTAGFLLAAILSWRLARNAPGLDKAPIEPAATRTGPREAAEQ